jgi:hypothetical protein
MLDMLLEEVRELGPIDYVDVYGGEIGVLPDEYLLQFYNTIRKYYDGEINVVTNLSVMKDFFFYDDIKLSVSYDFEHREQHHTVLTNILLCPKEIALLILGTPDVLKRPVLPDVEMLNSIQNITSVEIKPYSTNQSNQYEMKWTDYEEYVKQWIEADTNFDFSNERQIQRCLSKEYNSYSDDHLYITPTGDFAVLEFDADDNEYFRAVTLDEYKTWCEWELVVAAGGHCMVCKYEGHCLTEHLRHVPDVDNSCNGFHDLLTWYEHEKT